MNYLGQIQILSSSIHSFVRSFDLRLDLMVEFEAEPDPFVCELARGEKRETFGLIVCALFHQAKPIGFAQFYHRLIERFHQELTDDEQKAIYLYPIDYLHITVTTFVNFKYPKPESPQLVLNYWKDAFEQLKKTSRHRTIHLVLETIELSNAAGFFQYRDDNKGIEYLRQSIKEHCQPENEQTKLHVPNIIHTTFLRFVQPLADPQAFHEKFHRISHQLIEQTPLVSFDIDEVCLALESHPYMHIASDQSHVLDTMKC